MEKIQKFNKKNVQLDTFISISHVNFPNILKIEVMKPMEI